jgi:hypothetical protein
MVTKTRHAILIKVGYSPYVNKAFAYISVFKILNFIRAFEFILVYIYISKQAMHSGVASPPIHDQSHYVQILPCL